MSVSTQKFIIAVVVLVISLTLLFQLHSEEARRRQVFGPDPAVVEFELKGGMRGTICVRDAQNMEQEVRQHIEGLRRDIEETPGMRVEGQWGPIEFVKLRKVSK